MQKNSDIETRSMAIIDRLLPVLDCSEKERQVVKRIVHATGDPEIASLIKFEPNAIGAGLAAIRDGRPIYTDVSMVKAGINKRLAGQFRCSVLCALTEFKQVKQVVYGNNTRSAAAFLNLDSKLSKALVVIGNAPTALLALVGLIDKGIIPSLVVGMPVGFVQAEESKVELSRRNIPYITIAGRRGGSPAAVATVNALLRLALEVD
ncbi:precorrin-8X methylmutase [Chloroflexota bacterium]